MIGMFLGGIFTDAFSSAVAAMVGITGLFGGGAHYAAVLARRTKPEIDRATAIGFFFGSALGLVVLLIDALA